ELVINPTRDAEARYARSFTLRRTEGRLIEQPPCIRRCDATAAGITHRRRTARVDVIPDTFVREPCPCQLDVVALLGAGSVEMRAGPGVVEAIKRCSSITRCRSRVIHRAFVGELRVVHEHGILFRLGDRVEVRAELAVEEAVNG